MPDLFAQFTKRARRVMTIAEEEARAFGHDYIGTEHLLLGVAREREGVGARALEKLDVDESRLRDAVTYVVARVEGMVSGKIELVPRAKHALELAVEEARRLRHHYIGTEHLLLGLLLEEDGVAAGVLAGLGVTVGAAREQVAALLGDDQPTRGVRAIVERAVRGRVGRAADAGETRGNVITVRVTDRDLAAIDALVDTGIRATRSDAAAWLIGAGIAANGELIDKLFATIDQIRELRAGAKALVRE